MTPATAVKAANTVMPKTAERPLSVGLLENRGLQQQYQQQKVNNQQQGFKQQRVCGPAVYFFLADDDLQQRE
jgi:hypothetical protein